MAHSLMSAKLHSVFTRALGLAACFLLLIHSPARSNPPEIDPALHRILNAPRTVGGTRSGMKSLGVETGSSIDVFLRTNDERALASSGTDAVRLEDGLYVARVEPATLRALIESGQVTEARLSRPVHMALDRSTAYLGLGGVRRPNLDSGTFVGQTGAGVAVGIVDTGVDWLHPDFKDAEGETRIDRYWDQLAYGARPPAGFPYGVEYTARSIDLGNAGGIDEIGHGTHVLGIAAGNGRGSFSPHLGIKYAGIAPEATLLPVRTNFTEAGVVLGCRYIFEHADRLEMPAVINLSLGNHFGPHRGTTPFETALADLVHPGHLIVAAAGNDGDRSNHAEVHLGDGQPHTLQFHFPGYDKGGASPFMAVEGWFPKKDRYRFTLRSPLGDVVGTLEFGNLEAEWKDVKALVRGWHTEDLGMGTVYLELADNGQSQRVATGFWRLEIEPITTSANSEIDFWIANWAGFPAGQEPGFTSDVDPQETLLSPATAFGVIAVGAVATRDCWEDVRAEQVCYASPPPLDEVAYFSSRGPTSDGRQKPEILAPGFGVVSARSSGISSVYATTEELDRLSEPSGLYYVSQGTSMAAPHATGTVALLLARYPRLTFLQAEHRLMARARHIEDWRDHEPALSLMTADALAPLADVALSELVPEHEGFRLRWMVARTRAPVQFRVYRGFEMAGPFTQLARTHIDGSNPYEILDTGVEPGRTHVYQIAAIETDTGLEDRLITQTGLWKGSLAPAFRAPDPNPAKSAMRFRYFVPASDGLSRVTVTVFDLAGRRIADLKLESVSSDGEGVAVWNLLDAEGRRVGSGVYFARMELRGQTSASRFVQRFVVLP
jgi:subtilisin family serine protease